jgi:transposase-like protein
MARTAKAAAAKVTRKRLTPEQKAEIAQAFARGEAGNAIAARLGVSTATIYNQKKKLNPIATEPMPHGESALRRKLVSFAVKTLLGESIDETERVQLEREVRAELVKRVAAGI